MGSKTCTKCNVEKSLEEYFKHTGMKDGRRPDCKVCHKIRSKKYYECNKDKLQHAHKEYYKEEHRAAATPLLCRKSIWSFIRAISGDTTRVNPSKTRAGSW